MTRASTRKRDRRSERGREDPRKSERASRVLFISSLWYNSRFLFSFTCKRHVVKLISRYSTYASLHPSRVSTPRRAAFIISLDFPLSLPSSAVPPPYRRHPPRHTMLSLAVRLFSFCLVVRNVLFRSSFALSSHLRAAPSPRLYTPTFGGRGVASGDGAGGERD